MEPSGNLLVLAFLKKQTNRGSQDLSPLSKGSAVLSILISTFISLPWKAFTQSQKIRT
jgi:hypothetical protein